MNNMKTLIIFTNDLEQINEKNDKFDYISESNLSLNELYQKCSKNYCYYLFIDININPIDSINISPILNILETNKPAILKLNQFVKIYHRSVIHYVYPLLDFKKYGSYIFDIQSIIEEPLFQYTYISDVNVNVNVNNLNNLNKNVNNLNTKIYHKLLKWFSHCIIKRYNNINVKYTILDQEIDKINFLDTFDIFKYFNIEHDYFKMKRIKFHKGNREIYGDCGLYHFLHDFHTSNRNSIINHLIKKYNYKKYLEIGVYNC